MVYFCIYSHPKCKELLRARLYQLRILRQYSRCANPRLYIPVTDISSPLAAATDVPVEFLAKFDLISVVH